MSKESESKSRDESQSKKPLVIYISENDHSDMSYGSVTEGIIRDCQEKGLNVQTFSEFESQTQKVEWGRAHSHLRNEPEPKLFEETTAFLDKQLLPMLSFDKRFPMEKEALKKSPYEARPMEAYDQLKDNVDNPEILQLLSDYKGNWVKGDNAEGTKGVKNLRNCFSYNQVHQAMADNIEDMLQIQTDVAIVVVGSAHIFGLDKKLNAFGDCQKIVVGNVPENLTTLRETLDRDGIETKEGKGALEEIFNHGGTPSSCARVGECVSFQVNPDSKEASIPDTVRTAINKRSIENAKKKEYSVLEEKSGFSSSVKNKLENIVQESREVFSQKVNLDALDLATTKEKETKKDPSEKSWVEKMADRKLSTSRDGHREI